MGKRAKGQGTIYRERDSARRTKWRAEKPITLPDGRPHRLITRGVTQDEALLKLERRERELQASHPDAERLTASEYLDRWLKWQRGRVGPSTMAELERITDRAKESFGHISLARVKPTHVQAAMDVEIEAGLLGTAEGIRRSMRSAFRQAERWDLLTTNPARNLEPVKRPATKRSAWEPWEAARFLDVVKARLHGGYYALFYMAVLTGMRRGELIALKWSDVTPTGVTVKATASRYAKGGVGTTTKTPAGARRIPITRAAFDTIAEARSKLPVSEWAFPSEVGSMLGERNVNRAFANMIEATHVPPGPGVKRMRLHDVRRTTATFWAAAGVPPKVIQKLLGHATPHVALAVYTDVLEGQLDDAALDPSRWIGGKKGVNNE